MRPTAIARRLADTGVRVLDVEVFRLEGDTRVADFERASDETLSGSCPPGASLPP